MSVCILDCVCVFMCMCACVCVRVCGVGHVIDATPKREVNPNLCSHQGDS